MSIQQAPMDHSGKGRHPGGDYGGGFGRQNPAYPPTTGPQYGGYPQQQQAYPPAAATGRDSSGRPYSTVAVPVGTTQPAMEEQNQGACASRKCRWVIVGLIIVGAIVSIAGATIRYLRRS